MQSGRALIDEYIQRRIRLGHHPTRRGVLVFVTMLCWLLWFYLILPLLSLLLWIVGVQYFVETMIYREGYQPLLIALQHYSVVLLAIIAVLFGWIWWNVARYRGLTRRRSQGSYVSIPELSEFFGVDTDQVAALKAATYVTVSFHDHTMTFEIVETRREMVELVL